ncbi:MAG: hypothetical protein EU517_01275, partial [Promethearchaeota archaeon]
MALLIFANTPLRALFISSLANKFSELFVDKYMKFYYKILYEHNRIEQMRNPLFFTKCEERLENLNIPKTIGDRRIWFGTDLIGGTDIFQIEETVKDSQGYFHSTGTFMSPFYMWLKYGNYKEGFIHIIEEHGDEHFENEWNLMSDREKSDAILNIVSSQKGYKIRSNLILYKVIFNGKEDYMGVSFS